MPPTAAASFASVVRGVTISKRELPADLASAFFDLRENALKSSSVVLTRSPEVVHPKIAGVDRRLIFLGVWALIIIVGRIIAEYVS